MVDGPDDASTRALDQLRSQGRDGGAISVVQFVRQLVARSGLQHLAGNLKVALSLIGLLLVALVIAVLIVKHDANNFSVEDRVVEGSSVPALSGATTTTAPGLVVDVGGAVRAPGVYRLPSGSRVVDALELAGGPAEDCDLDVVNLAALIVDGQRIWISRKGQSTPNSDAGVAAATPSTSQRLDLNTATIEQLDTLPGIGPSTARAIIEKRLSMGRFRSVDDLLSVKGIGDAKLDSLRDSVVVR